MNLDKKIIQIRSFCLSNADQTIVKKYAHFFTEGYDAYGIEPKLLEKQREKWLIEWREELGFEGFLELCDLLVQNGKYEEGSFAIWFASAFVRDFKPETLEHFGGWLEKYFRNWAHTDGLSLEVLSKFLTRDIVKPDAFSEWRASPSKWKRRSVPVSFIKALKKDAPVELYLEFLAPMMSDSEKVVHQGLGWFLREGWKKEPEAVEKFLLEWKDTCARLIIQYATEKMSAEEKALFKKSKKTGGMPSIPVN